MPSNRPPHNKSNLPEKDAVTHALELFGLEPPFSLEMLKQRYEELLFAWNPHRNANLTNNPTKYMQMYKRGEVKTKEVQAAFQTLMTWLNHQNQSSRN